MKVLFLEPSTTRSKATGTAIETLISFRSGWLRSVLPVLWIMIISAGSAIQTSAQNALPLGSNLPASDVVLTASDGSTATLGSLTGDVATVVVFWSNKCPWCTKLEDRLAKFIAETSSSGVSVVLINSNDPNSFPKESLEANGALAKKLGVPYLSDANGLVMKALGASRNPHFFVFDADNTLSYLGGFDDSPGDSGNAKKSYLVDAVSEVTSGKKVGVASTKAFGCMIKPAK